MIKRKELTYDNSYLLKVFNRDFPHLVTMAEESQNIKLFREALRSFVSSRIEINGGANNHLFLAITDGKAGRRSFSRPVY